jgi:hypothetical protein
LIATISFVCLFIALKTIPNPPDHLNQSTNHKWLLVCKEIAYKPSPSFSFLSYFSITPKSIENPLISHLYIHNLILL